MRAPEVFIATPESERIGRAYFLGILRKARASMTPTEFRLHLRETMLADPHLTLHQVAQALGVTRQRVSLLVGRLDRPCCTDPSYPRPAPRKAEASRHLGELIARVQAGEPAGHAASALGISLGMATKLGFRSRLVHPPHGTQSRLAKGCNCWRCRRSGGIALPRGPKTGPGARAAVEDWLAWVNPEDGTGLTQVEIGRLVGIGQGAVSRIARSNGGVE